MTPRHLLSAGLLLGLVAPAQAVDKIGEQRLFGQCTALVLGGKSRSCESVTLGHNADGRSYFEIPSSAGTVLIGGERSVGGPRLNLRIDSLDPGTGDGETAFGTCQMQMNPGLETLAALTCNGAGGQTGQFMFVFKPTAQKVDGRLPVR